jgi:hypothetical protein
MGGLEPCPGYVFLKAVDLVLEREIAAQTTPRDPPAEPDPAQSADGRTPRVP